MKYRYYQENARKLFASAFEQGHEAIIGLLPTGGGKTVIFARECREEMLAGGIPMVLVNRKELLDQAVEKLRNVGVFPELIAAGRQARTGKAYVASIETLARRDAPDVTLLICDEVHIEQHDKIIALYKERNPKLKIIGFTATPLRMKGSKRPLSKIFTEIVPIATIAELLEEGYLVPCKTYGVQLDVSGVKKKSNGEFDDSAVFDLMNQKPLYDGVIDNYRKFAWGTKALCFNQNVAHSLKMTEEFNKAGIPAVHLDGTTPAALRKSTIDLWRKGIYWVLCNVGLFTTGFDEPAVKCVIENRVTDSLPLKLQMEGRGSRPSVNVNFDTREERLAAIANSDKPHFIVLDHGGNWQRHGLWQSEREWSLVTKRSRAGQGASPIKICDGCEALIPKMATICEYCGQGYLIKKDREKKLVKGEFVEIKDPKIPEHLYGREPVSLSAQEMIEYQESMQYDINWTRQIMRLQAVAEAEELGKQGQKVLAKDILREKLTEVAQLKKYQPGWIYRQMKMEEKSLPSAANLQEKMASLFNSDSPFFKKK